MYSLQKKMSLVAPSRSWKEKQKGGIHHKTTIQLNKMCSSTFETVRNIAFQYWFEGQIVGYSLGVLSAIPAAGHRGSFKPRLHSPSANT